MENVDIAPPNMDFGPSDSTTYSAENPMLVRERVCFDTDDSKFGEFQIKNEEREVEINDQSTIVKQDRVWFYLDWTLQLQYFFLQDNAKVMFWAATKETLFDSNNDNEFGPWTVVTCETEFDQ